MKPSYHVAEMSMEMKLDPKVLTRAREIINQHEGADGVYEFPLGDAHDSPRVVIASDRAALLALNTVQYDGKTFYIGFPH